MTGRARLVVLIAAACLSVAGWVIPASTTHRVVARSEGDQEQVVVNPQTGTACGIERWYTKTGMDSTASSVNLHAIHPSTVSALAALSAPSQSTLDSHSRSRIRPVETTVYQLNATLLRFKEEADSDYHLVLSDGSHTMTAEIPATYC